MEIESRISLTEATYRVQVGLAASPTALTPVEREAVAQFGEPVIELGGAFTQADPSLTFSLPAAQARFPGQFPISQAFSLADYAEDANERAVLFRNTLITRLEAARTALLTQSAGTTGTQVTIIS
jgi:hypothetical protein